MVWWQISVLELVVIYSRSIFIDKILNIYSPVNITASDQRSPHGPVWKPIDGVKGPSSTDSWGSLTSAKSWWRLEFQSRTVISRVVIYPRNLDSTRRKAMNGFTVYIGDSTIGNGSSNALCGQPWKATVEASEITINCLGRLVGKYLYVAAADAPLAALFLSEISVYGCQGVWLFLRPHLKLHVA